METQTRVSRSAGDLSVATYGSNGPVTRLMMPRLRCSFKRTSSSNGASLDSQNDALGVRRQSSYSSSCAVVQLPACTAVFAQRARQRGLTFSRLKHSMQLPRIGLCRSRWLWWREGDELRPVFYLIMTSRD